LEPVADPSLGQDQSRLAGIALQLLAELTDEHPQILDVVLMRGAPHGGQQLAMREHLAGRECALRQQVILARAE
jgi:hypothetical protein